MLVVKYHKNLTVNSGVYVPAVGGAGGAGVSASDSLYMTSIVHGRNGGSGTNRKTGGGGSGGATALRGTGRTGSGGAGTSYSGGAGSGVFPQLQVVL